LAGGDMQEVLEELFSRYGEEGVAVITRSNKRANLFNTAIRTRILGREEDLDAGDRLMIVRNNYHWLAGRPDFANPLLANGDAIEVLRIVRRFERYGAPFAEVEARLLDAPPHEPFTALLHLSVLHTDAPALPAVELRALYEAVAEDYIDLGDRRRIHKAVLADPCYQALQVKFAWAITCHKAQGGQWPAVVVDQGFLTEEHLNVELHRWMYTAFTRARERLYLLNFVDAFFPPD
jgi:exodeoxyribonuclease-5